MCREGGIDISPLWSLTRVANQSFGSATSCLTHVNSTGSLETIFGENQSIQELWLKAILGRKTILIVPMTSILAIRLSSAWSPHMVTWMWLTGGYPFSLMKKRKILKCFCRFSMSLGCHRVSVGRTQWIGLQEILSFRVCPVPISRVRTAKRLIWLLSRMGVQRKMRPTPPARLEGTP